MNMQAILKQAQNLQKDMMKEQEKINSTIFEGESSLVVHLSQTLRMPFSVPCVYMNAILFSNPYKKTS